MIMYCNLFSPMYWPTGYTEAYRSGAKTHRLQKQSCIIKVNIFAINHIKFLVSRKSCTTCTTFHVLLSSSMHILEINRIVDHILKWLEPIRPELYIVIICASELKDVNTFQR